MYENMLYLNDLFLPEIEFLHENFSLYHFPYINNKIQTIDKKNHILSIYGLEGNTDVFKKIYNEISYCNKKNILISCNVSNPTDLSFVAYEQCFATSLNIDFVGMYLVMKFELFKPSYYLAGAPAVVA